MPASALLKFVQGSTVGGDGRALLGVLSTSVSISNVNNATVQSWQIDLVYADPLSSLDIAVPYAFNDASSTPSASFAPDVRRSFRWQLKVWSVPNRAGDPDSIDIRVFSIRELNGVIIPPSQVWPLPLPDPRTGDPAAKPNEMNFDGQVEGWHGTGSDGLMGQVLARHTLPLPGSNGEVATVVGGRWVSAPPPSGGGGNVEGPGGAVVDSNIVLWDGTTGTKVKDAGISLAAYIRHNGTVAFTGSQSMGGFKITSLATGTLDTDGVNLGQVKALLAGLDPKPNVRAYSTTNVALTGLGALGGVASFLDGDRVGLGGQTNPSENGIWVKHPLAWTRPTDFAAGMDVSGAYFFVEEGTFADKIYLVQSDTGSAIVGSSNLTLGDFGTSTALAGDGLVKSGNTISALLDGATLAVSVSGLKVATAGITANELAVSAVNLATNKVTGLLPFANIADGSAASVFGRSANSTGAMGSIAASADGQVLRRAAGALSWGAVDLADTDAVTGLLSLSNIANLGALSVLGRASNTTGAMAAITGTDGQVLRVAGTTLGFGSIVTAGIGDAQVTLAKLANGSASSVLGRSAATGGAYADIVSSADGQVLRRGASGVIGWGAVDLADTDAVTGLLPFTNIANGAATSVLARASGTTGAVASLAATSDGQILQRVAGALTWASFTVGSIPGGSAVGQVLINTVGNAPAWGALDLADADGVTGQLAFSNIASLAGVSVLGRAANTTGPMAAVTGTADQVLRVDGAGTALAFGQLATGAYGASSVTLAKLADGGAASVLGRSAGTTGPYADIAASADGQVLRRAAGVLGWGAVDLADTDAVTGLLPIANLASIAGISVLGRGANSTGALAPITGAASTVLRVTGDGTTLSFGLVPSAALGANSVDLSKLPNASASSVLGRSAASSGVYADITSSADGQVLRRGASGVVAFGAVDLADADAITGTLPLSALGSQPGNTIIGRSGGTAGNMQAITGAANTVLGVDATGTVMAFDVLNPQAIANRTIPLNKLAIGTLNSVLGRSTFTNGDRADILATVGGTVLRFDGNDVAFGAVDLADADATTGLLAGTKVSPNFGAQNITSTGFLTIGTAGVAAIRLPNNSDIYALSTGAVPISLAYVNTSNGIIYGDTDAVSLSLVASGGSKMVFGSTAAELGGGISELRFDNSITGGVTITHESIATAGLATANKMSIQAQSRTGTGATVGAELELMSGNGATPGVLTLKTGATTALSATPTTGAVAVGDTTFVGLEHAYLGGRDIIALCSATAITTTQMPTNTGSGVVYWKIAAADPTANPTTGIIAYATIDALSAQTTFCTRSTDGVMRLGAQALTAMELRVAEYPGTGSISLVAGNIALGDGSSPSLVVTPSSARVSEELRVGTNLVLFDLAADMTNCDGVLHLANASLTGATPVGGGRIYAVGGEARWRSPLDGEWAFGPNTEWKRNFFQPANGSTNSTSVTTISTQDLTSLPSNCAGTIRARIFVKDATTVLGAGALDIHFRKSVGVLSVLTSATAGGTGNIGTATATVSGANLLVQLAASGASARTYKTLLEVTYALQ